MRKSKGGAALNMNKYKHSQVDFFF